MPSRFASFFILLLLTLLIKLSCIPLIKFTPWERCISSTGEASRKEKKKKMLTAVIIINPVIFIISFPRKRESHVQKVILYLFVSPHYHYMIFPSSPSMIGVSVLHLEFDDDIQSQGRMKWMTYRYSFLTLAGKSNCPQNTLHIKCGICCSLSFKPLNPRREELFDKQTCRQHVLVLKSKTNWGDDILLETNKLRMQTTLWPKILTVKK